MAGLSVDLSNGLMSFMRCSPQIREGQSPQSIRKRYRCKMSGAQTKKPLQSATKDNSAFDAPRAIRPAHVQPDDLVLPTERGTPMDPASVQNRGLDPASLSLQARASKHYRFSWPDGLKSGSRRLNSAGAGNSGENCKQICKGPAPSCTPLK